jgi:hypothetical protein
MQRFNTSGDFVPPSYSDSEFEAYMIKWLLDEAGPLVSERSYVERFLHCISTGKIQLKDIQTFMIGVDRRTRSVSTAIPLDLLTHYRDALDAAIAKQDRVNANVCKILFSRIKGKVFKVPATEDGVKIIDRIAAVDHFAAMEYAYWLSLSEYKVDLCKCGYCKKYFLAESKGLGRTSRKFCNTKHMKKHRAATGAARTDASRAGVSYAEWRKIQTEDPGITPGDWKKIDQERASGKHT